MRTPGVAKSKLTRTRIVEILLLTFTLACVARATPNLDMLPNIPWAEDRTNGDLGNTDDKAWGNYARMEFMATHPPAGGVSGVSKERMFNHIYASGQSRKRSKSIVGYLNSSSSISGATVCRHRNVRMSVHVYVETGPSCTGSGVNDSSFGVSSPDTFFVGVEDCAIDAAVCGVLAKLLEEAKDSAAVNMQHRITAHLAG
jgi:hypothetical protein